MTVPAATGPERPARPVELSAATTVVGVIGDPVAHSLSPHLHNTAFAELGLDWVSVAFRVEAGRTAAALEGARALGVRGLSVTMPHKDEAARLAAELSPLARRLGAVNCLVPAGDAGDAGHAWRGENTDGAGLLAALRHRDGFEAGGRRCLVVGAGGAARAVIAALADARAAEVIVVNRTQQRAAAAAALAGGVGRVGEPTEATSCDLVVNATPVGMADTHAGPGGQGWPVDPTLLHAGQIVVDLVYHPAETPWMAAARSQGATADNGLGMLVHQAALQLTAWTGLEPPVAAMWEAVRDR
jgi:shikimate dehydrogenase